MRSGRDVEVGVELFKNILQRGGERHTGWDAEAKAMRLAWTMIGILSHDHHLDRLEGSVLKRTENEGIGRINGMCTLVLLLKKSAQGTKVGFLPFCLKKRFP
jgi:hypothetical protein